MLREGFQLSPDYDLLNDTDLITQHPPERGERKKSYLVVYSCGSCCSTCCCCLHTVGGVFGAAIAGNFRPEAVEPEDGATTLTPAERPPGTQWLFWSSFFIVAAIGNFLTICFMPEHFGISVISILIYGPVWMLGGSVLAALRIAFRTDLPQKAGYWSQLSKITVGMLAGSCVGLIMLHLMGVPILPTGIR